MSSPKILYVDDEVENLDAFALSFLHDYEVFTASSGAEGLALLAQEAASESPVALVISDQRMPEMSGVDFLEQVSLRYPDVVKMLLTGYSDIQVAIECINRVGLYRFLTKPWKKQELKASITQALELARLRQENHSLIVHLQKSNESLKEALCEVEILKQKLEEENVYLREEVDLQKNFKEIITQSPLFKKTLRAVEKVAPTDTTVLILGETGVGKELIARSVHNISRRHKRPLVKVNCAALPVNLIESELFGHEKGAFTGAFQQKIGRFELADGGTLFLDEIGELPLELQAKLLRVLQEGEFERLGSNKTLKVDVRLIAATNRQLEKEIEKGTFREDLYFRLHVFPIQIPPLRQRKEDIPPLTAHFVEKFCSRLGRKILQIPQKAIEQLQAYDFPGNVRELENLIERAVIISPADKLTLPPLQDKKRKNSEEEGLLLSLEENERQHILRALKATKGRIHGEEGAAKILQINASTLRSRMEKLGIKLNKNFDEIS
jgi:DNA-binding NtrC family response regulator